MAPPANLRRRLAGLVLLVAVLIIGGRFFLAHDKVVPVEIHYRLGDAPSVQSLAATWRQPGTGEAVATFQTRLIAPDVVQKTRMPPGTYDVDIVLDDTRSLHRTAIVQRDAVVSLDLQEGR